MSKNEKQKAKNEKRKGEKRKVKNEKQTNFTLNWISKNEKRKNKPTSPCYFFLLFFYQDSDSKIGFTDKRTRAGKRFSASGSVHWVSKTGL